MSLDKYQLVKKLGKGGSAEVYLAKDVATSKQLAIKILKPTNASELEKFSRYSKREMQALKNIDHKNVIKLYDCKQHIYTSPGSLKQETFFALVIEYLQSSDMYEYIEKTGAMPENLARFYFKQIVDGLDHCHEKGYAHRDMKLENLLLDKDFNLKIVDFGFSTKARGQDGTGLLQRILGTSYYMAPEMYSSKGYNGINVDIFAIGVILFMLLCGHYPFHRARPDDAFYGLIMQGKWKEFWNYHGSNKDNASHLFNPDLVSLISGLLEANPKKRMTLAQVKEHKWFKKPAMKGEDVAREMGLRKFMISKKEKSAKLEKGKVDDEIEACIVSSFMAFERECVTRDKIAA